LGAHNEDKRTEVPIKRRMWWFARFRGERKRGSFCARRGGINWIGEKPGTRDQRRRNQIEGGNKKVKGKDLENNRVCNCAVKRKTKGGAQESR